jgi:hypothetical protein
MKKYVLILFAFLTVFSEGCKKFLDINHDPNNLETNNVKPELLFPAAVENSAAMLGSYGLLLGEIWSQHWTSADNAPQYQAEDSYQVTAGDFNYDLGIWRGLYTGALMDYEQIRIKTLAEENWSYYFMATTMQCYVFQILADFWDEIPMSDALKNKPPKYDNGQAVYDTLIARLNFAIAHFDDWNAVTSDYPENDDLIFNGNEDNWLAFANTLKLKIFLRQVYVRPQMVDSVKKMITDGTIFLTVDAKFNDFIDQQGRDNYMYAMEWRGGNTNMRASQTLLEFLKQPNQLVDANQEDSRYHYIFETNEADTFSGMLQGDFRNRYSFPGNSDPALSSPLITPTMPFYFMSKAESYFLQAEAYLRNEDLVSAKVAYENGILADYERLRETVLGAGAYVHTYPTLAISEICEGNAYANFDNAADFEARLEKIIVQKWIALANIGGFEAFFEHNRTGYPRESNLRPGTTQFLTDYIKGQWIVSVTGVLSAPVEFPKRLIFTSTEQNKNPDNVPDIKPLNVKVWWDVKSYPY